MQFTCACTMKQVTLLFGCLLSLAVLCIAAETADADDFDWMEELLDSLDNGVDQGRNPPPPPNPVQMDEADGQRWRNPPPPPNPVQMDEAHDNEEESNGTPSPEYEIPEDFLNEFDDEFNSDESNGDDTETLQIQGLEEKLKLLSGVGRLIIGVGYNLLRGNPDGEGNSAADPGIQTGSKVLKTDYDDTVSDPIKVVPHSDCSASKTVGIYSGTKGYQEALGVDVTAEGTIMMCTVIVILSKTIICMCSYSITYFTTSFSYTVEYGAYSFSLSTGRY